MKPLSKSIRRTYLTLLILLFIILVPVTILYSTGYRLGEHFTVVKTGGIYIGLNEPGARLFLNGKFVQGASILKNGFFVQDLTPRVYHVIIEKEGYRKWEKVLEVAPQRVVEASAFILPQEITFKEISPVIQERNGNISNEEYIALNALFATSTTETSISLDEISSVFATSTKGRNITNIKKKGDIILWQEGDIVYARWVSDRQNAPSYFCEGVLCGNEIQINKTPIRFFDFHPHSNELLVIGTSDGIGITEIDPRIPRNTQMFYQSEGVDTRVVGDTVFIKNGNLLYSFVL